MGISRELFLYNNLSFTLYYWIWSNLLYLYRYFGASNTREVVYNLEISTYNFFEFFYNSITIGDSSRVFADYVFLYLRLFTLTYVSPIYYVIYLEDRVLAENQLAWTFTFIPVARREYGNGCCH